MRSSFRKHALHLSTILTLTALCSPRTAVGQGPPAAPEAVDSALLELAAIMYEAAPRVSRIWPGFWLLDQRFLLLRPTTTALLVGPGDAPPEYTPISFDGAPPELRGVVYLRETYPEELGPNTFSTAYHLDGETVPALEPKGSSTFSRLGFYYHESFHGYQRSKRGFAVTPEDRRTARYRAPLVDPAHIESPEFRAGVERERRMLAAALTQSAPDSLRTLLHGYMAARRARTAGVMDVLEVERRMERREGTATYVECWATTEALRAPAERAKRCVLDELEQPLDSLPAVPESDARLMRYRLYGTGAAIAFLLDRLRPGWKRLVEDGMHLDALLAQAIDFDPDG